MTALPYDSHDHVLMRRAVLHTGRESLDDLGALLDDLFARTGCSITARRLWLQTWAEHYTAFEPLVVVVSDGHELRAAAPLAVRRVGGLALVVPLGDGPSDSVRFPSLTDADAKVLAEGVLEALGSFGSPWRLRAGQLDPADAAVGALASVLPCGRLWDGEASPWLSFGADRSLRAHVSRNHHQQVRRMRNRLTRDGLEPEIAHLSSADEVEAVWPELEVVCRARDVQVRSVSVLDDTAFGPFFRDVVAQLAARGEVRLTTVRLQGRLASYVLSFQDGPVRRMWNCRLDPDFQHFGVGRIANDAALQDALDEPQCSAFDWMRGEEPYKASMSNQLHRAVDLTACSHRSLSLMLDGLRSARVKLKDTRDRHGPAGRLIASAVSASERLRLRR